MIFYSISLFVMNIKVCLGPDWTGFPWCLLVSVSHWADFCAGIDYCPAQLGRLPPVRYWVQRQPNNINSLVCSVCWHPPLLQHATVIVLYFILFYFFTHSPVKQVASFQFPCHATCRSRFLLSVLFTMGEKSSLRMVPSGPSGGKQKHLFRLHACANMADSFEHTCLEKTIRPKTYVPLKTVEQYCTFVYCSTQGDRQSTDKTASVGGFSNDFCYLFHCVWCKVWRCFLVAVQITASNHSLGFSQ